MKVACCGAFCLLGESDIIIIASDTATFFDPHITYGMTTLWAARGEETFSTQSQKKWWLR